MSFADFPELIDAMGGITYRGGCVVSRINGGFKNGGYTLRLPAGKTHIDGKQALALARTRYNDCNKREDDLTRARRQQKVISAMKRRLLSPFAFVRMPMIALGGAEVAALGHERADAAGPVRRAVVLRQPADAGARHGVRRRCPTRPACAPCGAAQG